MKTTKYDIIPAQPARPAQPERTIEVSVLTCDLCGKEAKNNYCDTPAEWETGPTGYEVGETQISFRSGVQYHDGGNSTTQSFCICPDCWSSKLVPWMQSQGANITTTDDMW